MKRDAELQPPFANFMGMKVTHLSRDKVEAEIFVREELNNRFGAMHGGAIMALADNLGGTATFANLPEGGVIRLSAQRNDDAVAIQVENSFDPDSPSSLKTGLGLENIRQRLNARYGSGASISVRTDGNCFLVNLRLPAQANGVPA